MSKLDRYGDDIDDSPNIADDWHDPYCLDGWLGEDLDGHPIPCLDCRPHLRRRRP